MKRLKKGIVISNPLLFLTCFVVKTIEEPFFWKSQDLEKKKNHIGI